jgi:hypothetical protein
VKRFRPRIDCRIAVHPSKEKLRVLAMMSTLASLQIVLGPGMPSLVANRRPLQPAVSS